jgi:hypothetical protein
VPPAATSSVPAVLTPHSGYHWDGLPRRFFEGWYFKVFVGIVAVAAAAASAAALQRQTPQLQPTPAS